MEDEIEGAEGVHLLNEIEVGGVGFVEDEVVEMGEVLGSSGDEVIDSGYCMAFGEELLAEVGADEAGGAGDQNVHSFSVVGLAS